MKRLWVAAALAPLSFAATVRAEPISGQTSTPVATATFNNGQPGDVTINSGGSIQLKTAGAAGAQSAAVTLNSNNNVANNGSITSRDLNFTTGILAQPDSFTSPSTSPVTITNSGAITLDESATQKTNGTTGITEGIFQNGKFVSNFALGSNRFGIQTIGTTPFNGAINNAGSITVIGENSAGISIDTGGITGALNTGSVTVTGDNSFGVHSAGLIGGAVVVSGPISATGEHATALALDGGTSANVDIANAITATGFHSLTAPFTTNQINHLQPSQLMQGGPAVSIGGSVGSGILVEPGLAATSTAAATTGGTITGSGSTALQIGGANPLTIGAASNSLALQFEGAVASNGTYQNFDATAVQLGVPNGGAVTIAGGIDISSTVSASSVATSLSAKDGAGNPIFGSATGIHVLSGTTLEGGITVSGSLIATSTSTVNNQVTALKIDSGAAGSVSLVNTGTIAASITGIGAVINGPPAAGGTTGQAAAISDQAGVITSITNTGTISATITPVVSTQTETGTTYALDLRGNTAGVTVTQSQAPVIPATASTSATTPAAPTITGDVLFGSGGAHLNMLAGTLTGAVSFGSSTSNSLDIENGALVNGALTEAAGGQLALTIGSGASSVTSILNNRSTSAVGLSSLNIGKSGEAIFTIDPANGQGSQFNVNGNATLAAGSKIGLNIISASPQVMDFDLITTTGTLTSNQPVEALLGTAPFLFNATLNETTGSGGSVDVTIAPKTPAQLGLNEAEAAAYPAVLSQLQSSADPAVVADVLSKTNRADFIHLYDQFLPDFEGGVFDTLVVAQGQLAQAEADTPLKLESDEPRGWVQEIGYLNNREDSTEANGYRAGGFGIIGGLEKAHGDSAVGVAAAFVTDAVVDDRQQQGANLSSSGVEFGVYWRYGQATEGLNMHASVNGGYMFMANHRLLVDQDTAGTVTLYRQAKSQWNSGIVSVELGGSYQIPMGRFYIRPEVIADYIYLYESAFSEHGGGPSMDLAVASRESSESSAQGDLVFGADLGGVYHWRPEITLGWRQVFSGGPGDTTARFVNGGPSFTLSPKFDDKGSIVARLGVRAGGQFADFSADAGGQYNNTYQVYDARAVARFLF